MDVAGSSKVRGPVPRTGTFCVQYMRSMALSDVRDSKGVYSRKWICPMWPIYWGSQFSFSPQTFCGLHLLSNGVTENSANTPPAIASDWPEKILWTNCNLSGSMFFLQNQAYWMDAAWCHLLNSKFGFWYLNWRDEIEIGCFFKRNLVLINLEAIVFIISVFNTFFNIRKQNLPLLLLPIIRMLDSN